MATDIYYSKPIQDIIVALNLGHKDIQWAINIELFCALSWGATSGRSETRKLVYYTDAKRKIQKREYRFDKLSYGTANKFKSQLTIKRPSDDHPDEIIYGHIVEMMTIFDQKSTTNSQIIGLYTEYNKLATFGDLSGLLDNADMLKSVYSESPEYIIAQRYKSLYDEIETARVNVNDMTDRLITADQNNAKKIIEITEAHKLTIGYYQRQIEQFKKDLKDANKLIDTLLLQQVDSIKSSIMVVYKILFDDILEIFDFEFRGGQVIKTEESLKFIEESLSDYSTPYTVYYVTDGHDRRHINSYHNTFTCVPGLIDAWSTAGSQRTIDVGSKKITFSMINVGGRSVISFDDPCKLFNATYREKIISGLTKSVDLQK